MKADRSAIEACRLRQGAYRSETGSQFGAFYIPFRSAMLKVVVDDGATSGWEHVSVSLPNRCPNWDEMSHIKALFWDDEESVMQFHPRRSDYVNVHANCLHMWRKFGVEPELPPKEYV